MCWKGFPFVKGHIDYFGKDNISVLLLNNTGDEDTADANDILETYQMQEYPRVQMEWEECAQQLMAEFGQFGWGYVVIGADGNLLGVNVESDNLGALLAKGVEQAAPVPVEHPVQAKFTDVEEPTDFSDSILTEEKRTASLNVTIHLPEGWYVYGPDTEKEVPTELTIRHSAGFVFGVPTFSEGRSTADGATHLDGPVKITIPVEIPKGTPIGHHFVHGTVRFQASNEEQSQPETELTWAADCFLW